MIVTEPFDLATLREGWDVEVKRAAGKDGKGALPKSFFETYSAMANADGGKIILGVAENEDFSFEVIGVAEPQRVLKDLWNQLNNREKVSVNLLTEQSIEEHDVGGKTVLIVDVPRAPRHSRPVYIGRDSMTGTYLRVADGDRKADAEVVRRMLADATPELDSAPLEEMALLDFDTGSVALYQSFLRRHRSDHPFLDKDPDNFLVSIGAAVPSPQTGKLRPTRAGLYMLGNEQAIRRLQPKWHLSYKEVPAEVHGERRWDHIISPDGTWNANLIQFFDRVYERLQRGLNIPFALQDGQRVSAAAAERALREAFLNTLIHADYQGGGGIRVTRNEKGFEFINPGLLLVSREQLWKGGISEPRNPALFQLFKLIGLSEREGSGGPTILREWRRQQWRAPHLLEDAQHIETHLQLSQESLLPDGVIQRLDAIFGPAFREQDALGKHILVTADVEGGTSHRRITELFEDHPADISKKLKELTGLGLLVSTGHGRGTQYSLAEESPDKASSSPDRASSSPDRASSSPDKAPSSPDRSTPEPERVIRRDSVLDEGPLPDVVQRVAGSRRATREHVKLAIAALCAESPQTLQQLAAALDRKRKHLRDQYLRHMVDSGELELTFPNTPNHPKQSYRSARTKEETK